MNINCSESSEIVYMDNSSTTKPFPEVIKAMSSVYEKAYGNPSSLHSMGSESEKLVHNARRSVASLIGADTTEIFFTSGGTESNNWAILGSFRAKKNQFNHVIATEVEHPSVTEILKYLNTLGYEISFVPVNNIGMVDPKQVVSLISEDTGLISIVFVQSEIGSVEPCHQIGSMLKQLGPKRPRFHVDAVQGFAKLDIDVKKWGIDLLSISSHKIHGPKGVGALYVRKDLPMYPLLLGGGQEMGLRSGTENVPGIVGFGVACDIWSKNTSEIRNKLFDLRRRLIVGIEELCPYAVLNGPRFQGAAPHIINFSFPGFRGETLVNALEKRKIFVSSGSACSSRSALPNRTILALGKGKSNALSSIRFSMSAYTTMKDIERSLMALEDTLKELKVWRRK